MQTLAFFILEKDTRSRARCSIRRDVYIYIYIYKGMTLKSSFSVSLLLMATAAGFSIYFQSVVEGQKSRGVKWPIAQRYEQ